MHRIKIMRWLERSLEGWNEKMEKWNIAAFRSKAKILIAFLQILSSFPSVLNVLYPDAFMKFLR